MIQATLANTISNRLMFKKLHSSVKTYEHTYCFVRKIAQLTCVQFYTIGSYVSQCCVVLNSCLTVYWTGQDRFWGGAGTHKSGPGTESLIWAHHDFKIQIEFLFWIAYNICDAVWKNRLDVCKTVFWEMIFHYVDII